MQKVAKRNMKGVVVPVVFLVLISLGLLNKVCTIMALFLCCVYMVYCNEEEYIAFLYFIMPFATLFKMSYESSSFFTYVELAFVLFHFCNKKMKATSDTLIASILVLYVVACECVSQTINVSRTIKFLNNLLLLGIITDIDIKEHYKLIFQSYIMGFVISGLFCLIGSDFLPIEQFVKVKVEYFPDGSSISRFAGLYADPNYFTINVIISLCLIVYMYHKKEISLAQTLLLSAILVFFVARTSSKSALIMLSIPVLQFVVNTIHEKRWMRLLCVLIIAGIVLNLVQEGRVNLFENTFKRLTSIDTGDAERLTSGRTETWSEYFEYFKLHPLNVVFGNGVGIYYLNGKATHNTYVDFIYQLGVCGTIMYVYILSRIERKVRKKIRRDINNFSVIITIFALYAFLSQMQEFDLPFQVALSLMVLNT